MDYGEWEKTNGEIAAGTPGADQGSATCNPGELPEGETVLGVGPMNVHPRPPTGRHMGGDAVQCSM